MILNYKTYEEATGDKAVELTHIAVEAFQQVKNINLVVCPQFTDIYKLKDKFPSLEIWSQHIDPIVPGRNTGWISPYSVSEAGGVGSILNHSEHKLTNEQILKTLAHCENYELKTCVAIASKDELEVLSNVNPNFIAYEPLDFISTDKSILDEDKTRAKEFIYELQNKVPQAVPLLGAGVRDADDVSSAIKIGFHGVLVASGFIKSHHPKEFIFNLLAGFDL